MQTKGIWTFLRDSKRVLRESDGLVAMALTHLNSPDRQPTILYGVTIGRSASSLLRGQLAWFREQGWRVVLVTSPDEAASQAAEREGVEFEPLKMHREISPLSDLRALTRWISVVRRYRPDAVNVSTPKAGLLGGLAAWALRVPRRLYVVRGLRAEGADGILGSVLRGLEWLSIHLATDVIFVSDSLAAECERLGLVSRSRSRVIGEGSSNGVQAESVSARARKVDRVALRTELGFTESDFVVGFVGRITRDKGVDTLLRALLSERIDSRVKLFIIGTLEEPEWGRQIDALGDRVTRISWTDDVWGHLAAIDVLTLPTLREGFPNVVLEAAAAGVPAITTRATGAIDSVVHGQTGFLIDVSDSAGLVDRINELADAPGEVARMGEAARERVVSKFRPETIWNGLQEILQQGMVAESSSSPSLESSIDGVK